MKRYSAMLMFQFRVQESPRRKRRLCEHVILAFKATDARAALAEAKRRARSREYEYANVRGDVVRYEFIGVEALQGHEISDEDVVWSWLSDHLLPMERRDRFMPPEEQLEAIRCGD